VEFPRSTDLEDGAADGVAEVVAIDSVEHDRRFVEIAERQARFHVSAWRMGLLRSVQDAEDAVQEALLKLTAATAGCAWRREGVSGADGVARGVGCGGAAASRDRAAGG